MAKNLPILISINPQIQQSTNSNEKKCDKNYIEEHHDQIAENH